MAILRNPIIRQSSVVKVEGLTGLLRAMDRVDADTRRFFRDELRKVGDIVRVSAVRRFKVYDERSAAGFRTRVRQRGVEVEQSYRKTTGLHPEYGRLQMVKALLPALFSRQAEINRRIEKVLDRVAAHFNS